MSRPHANSANFGIRPDHVQTYLYHHRLWFSSHVVRQALLDNVAETLDSLESHLEGRSFIAGCDYGLADVVWTVFLARAKFLGVDHWFWPTERPNLASYFEHMTRRPSFSVADIYISLPRTFLLRSLCRAHGRNVLLLLSLVGLSLVGLSLVGLVLMWG